jgi:hypothetical protein
MGCNLGEDAFLTEEVMDFSNKNDGSQQFVEHGLHTTRGDVDIL